MQPRDPRSRAALVALTLSAVGCGLPDYEFTGAADASIDTANGGSAGEAGADSGVGGAAGTDAAAGCTGDATCTDPTKPKCVTATGSCVACLPNDDVCPDGSYCVGTSCVPGCKGAGDCPAPLTCQAHECLGCQEDDSCPLGTICDLSSTACVPGCTPTHACDNVGNFTCCSGSCAALAIDADNCGSCGKACPTPANGMAVCQGGQCDVACTIPFSFDCNGDILDGCEADLKTDPQHCGACNKPCAAGQSCVDGACA